MMTHPPDDAHRASSRASSPDVLTAARWCSARGWVVFPCDHPDAGLHCTGADIACRQRRCKAERERNPDPFARGKHPRVRWSDYQEPVTDAQLVAWFGGGPVNLGIACGPSGLFVIDEDRPGALAAFAAALGEVVPATFTVATARGTHFYFTPPPGVVLGNSTGALPAGLDVRGAVGGGGYVIGPGSVSARDGRAYRVTDWALPAVELPPWLVEAVSRPAIPGSGVGPGAGGSGGTVPGLPAGPAEGRAGSQPGSDGQPTGTRATASDVTRWADAPRYGTAAEFLGQFAQRCALVDAPGDVFRHRLFDAARDGYRCVALGLLDEPAMLTELATAVWRVWQAEPDDDDHAHVEAGRLAAELGPWQFTTAEAARRTLAGLPTGPASGGARWWCGR
jgi:hypothetical protein